MHLSSESRVLSFASIGACLTFVLCISDSQCERCARNVGSRSLFQSRQHGAAGWLDRFSTIIPSLSRPDPLSFGLRLTPSAREISVPLRS